MAILAVPLAAASLTSYGLSHLCASSATESIAEKHNEHNNSLSKKEKEALKTSIQSKLFFSQMANIGLGSLLVIGLGCTSPVTSAIAGGCAALCYLNISLALCSFIPPVTKFAYTLFVDPSKPQSQQNTEVQPQFRHVDTGYEVL